MYNFVHSAAQNLLNDVTDRHYGYSGPFHSFLKNLKHK
jgi:hypothetical protein